MSTKGEEGFPPGESEVGALIRAFDWSTTRLGPITGWPAHLKAAVSLMLPAKAQIVLFWGPEFVAVYNDAYAPTIGEKHPRALGRPARENWAELWDDLEPLLRRVLDTGETVFAQDRPFYIERHGYPKSVYFDISYSPVLSETGEIGGRPLHRERDDRAGCCTARTGQGAGTADPSPECRRNGRHVRLECADGHVLFGCSF